MPATEAKNRKVLSRLKPVPKYGRTFIREWRESQNLTLDRLAERIGSTHATLSRIERGMQPYSQPLLEALAEALQTDPASLLVRNPADGDAPWTIWDRLKPAGQKRAIRLLKALAEEEAA